MKTPNKYMSTLSAFVLVAVCASAIISLYMFAKNNLWHPKVSVKDVDWEKTTATIIAGGEEKQLFDGATLSVGGDWGVRFSKKSSQDTDESNRIELVKGDKVYSYLVNEQTA